jgi:phosphoesterase RecJ-like protein
MPEEARKRALAALEGAGPFVVAAHDRPDGDSVGASLGLASWLRSRGARADVVAPQGIPPPYDFLPGAGAALREWPSSPGELVLVVLDTPLPERAGLPGGFLERTSLSVNIDHHPDNTRFADVNVVDPTASSAALIVSEILEESGRPLGRDVATLLYAGVLTDTGSFRFGNTDARTFEAAARLSRAGADPAHVARRLYGEQPVGRMKLLGLVLASMERALGGRVAVSYLTRAMREETGSSGDEIEGLASWGRLVEGVEVALLLREEAASVRGSLRSNGDVDVNAIARTMGGGGHRAASGFTYDGTLEEAREAALASVREALG